MNKKGFTLVELITTFALATVIIVLLINIVLLIKNIYSKNNSIPSFVIYDRIMHCDSTVENSILVLFPV